jgi:hypothetical protein
MTKIGEVWVGFVVAASNPSFTAFVKKKET